MAKSPTGGRRILKKVRGRASSRAVPKRAQPGGRFAGLTGAEYKFLFRFFASFVVMFLVIKLLPLAPALTGLAGSESGMLNSLGVNAFSQGATIATDNIAFQIVPECSGLVMVAMLAALVYSTKVKDKLVTVLYISPFLLVFNIFRLLATLYAGATWGTNALNLVHMGLWVFDALLVIFIWTRLADKRNPLGA